MGILNKLLSKFSPAAKHELILQEIQENYNKLYKSQLVNKDDYVDIMDLFWKSFTAHEPCFLSSGLARQHNPWFEQIIIDELCYGYSLKSICKSNGKIVGAFINSVVTPNTIISLNKYAENCCCEKTAELIRFYGYIHETPCLFQRLNTHVIFELAYMMVDPCERGRKIGMNLLLDSRKLARDANFSFIRIDCTSEYTSRLCQRLNFREMWTMPYSKYLGPDGKQLYRPPEPHTVVRCFVDCPKLLCKYCTKIS